MISRVHERALRVILGDDLSDFESLLQSNRDIAPIIKISKLIMIEIFKMDSMLERRNEPYNLRNFQKFLTEKKTVRYGLETLSYRSPQ